MNDEVKFGLKKVKKNDKTDLVSSVFTSVADKYNIMNDLMSFGMHRLWKEKMIKMCNLKTNDNVLDLATGSGDIAARILQKDLEVKITCLDENQDMLEHCKNTLLDMGYTKGISYMHTSAESAELLSNEYDVATIAFGFRNFSDHEKALQNIYKSLKPGGKIIIMEFTTPKNKTIESIFEKYTFNVIPYIGKYIANDYDSYKYLAESIKTYYSPKDVLLMLKDSSFINTKYIYLPGNMVTIHTGHKN